MVERGDWLTPHYNYEPRFQKPILFYWLVAATYTVAGIGETQARLWAALSGVGLVAGGRSLPGRRWFDARDGADRRRRSSRPAFGYFSIGRLALPDLPLAFFITVTDRAPRSPARSTTIMHATRGLHCRGRRRRLRLPHQGPGRPARSGAGAGADLVARAPAVPAHARAARWARLPSRLAIGAPWYVAMAADARTAPTSRVSSSATTSNASPRAGSTIRARSGSICRSCSAACCRGRRSCAVIAPMLRARADPRAAMAVAAHAGG